MNNKIKYAHEFLLMCDRSGSQPANLENVGRRPSLQSAQSDSNLRTGTLTQTHNPFMFVHVSFTLKVKWMLLPETICFFPASV